MSVITGRLPHRKVAGRVSGRITDGAEALAKPEALLLSGKTVRFRWEQSLVWSAVTGLLAAGFIAGLYDGILQVNWYIRIGSFYYHLFYL
jgi:hypothetical protein